MKDINKKSWEGTALRLFHEEVDRILGTRAASNAITLIESSVVNASKFVIGKLIVRYIYILVSMQMNPALCLVQKLLVSLNL